MSSKYIKWIQVLSILLALLSMGQLMFTATLLFLISIILSKSGGYVATICGLIASLVCLPTAFKIRTHYGNKDEQKIRHYDIQTYHRCMLYISLGVQTFCALVCFACLTQNETTEVALTSAITKYQQKFSDKKFLDIVQVLFQCCGIYSYEDWAQKTWISATKQQIFCKHEFNDETFKNVETSPTAELNAKFLTAVPYSCCKIETSKPCRNFDLKCSGVKTINTNGCITELNTFITSIICSELIIYLFSIAVVVAMLKFFNWEETEIYLSDGDDYSKLEGDDIEKAADLKSSDIKSPKKRVHEEYIHRTTTSREPKSKIEEKITSPKILSPPTQKPSVIETTTESKSRSNSSIPDTKSKESLPSDREDKKLPEDGTRKSIKPVAEPSKTNISARKSIKPTSEPSIPKKSVKPAEDLFKTGTSSRKSIKPPTDTKPEFSSHKSIKTHAESPKASASPRKSMKPHVESSKTNNTARKSMKPPEDPSKTSASPRKSMKPHAPPSKTDTKKSMKPLEDLSKTSASPRKSMKPHAAPYKTDTKKSMKPPEDSSKTSASSRKSMKPHTENKDLRGGSNKLDKPLKHKRSRAGLSLLRRKKKKKKEEATPVASPTSSIDPSPAPSPVPSPAPSLVPSQIVVPAQTPPTSVSVTPSDSSAMTITPTGSKSILKKRDQSSSSSSSDSRSPSNRVKFIDEVEYTTAHEKTTAELIPSKQEQIYITCDRQITLIPTCPTTVMTCQGVPVTPVCKISQNNTPVSQVQSSSPPQPLPSTLCQKPQCGHIQTQTDKSENPQIIQVNPPNIYICPPTTNIRGSCPEPQQIYPTIKSSECSNIPSPQPCGSFDTCSSKIPKVCPSSTYKLPENKSPKSSSCSSPLHEKFTMNYTNYMTNPTTLTPDVGRHDIPNIQLPNPFKKKEKKIEDYVNMPCNFISKSCAGKCKKPVIEDNACYSYTNSNRCTGVSSCKKPFELRPSSSCCSQSKPSSTAKMDRKVSFSTSPICKSQVNLPEYRKPRRSCSEVSNNYIKIGKKDWICSSDIQKYYNFFSKPGEHINSPRSLCSWSTSSLDSYKTVSRRTKPCCSRESIYRKRGTCKKRREKYYEKKDAEKIVCKSSYSSTSSSSEDDISNNLSCFADLNIPRPKACCMDKDKCFMKLNCLSEDKCGSSKKNPIDLNLFQYEPNTSSLDLLPIPVSFPVPIPSPTECSPKESCQKCINSDLCQKKAKKYNKDLEKPPMKKTWKCTINVQENGKEATRRNEIISDGPQNISEISADPQKIPESRKYPQSSSRNEDISRRDSHDQERSALKSDHLLINNDPQKIYISSPRIITLRNVDLKREAPKFMILKKPSNSEQKAATEDTDIFHLKSLPLKSGAPSEGDPGSYIFSSNTHFNRTLHNVQQYPMQISKERKQTIVPNKTSYTENLVPASYTSPLSIKTMCIEPISTKSSRMKSSLKCETDPGKTYRKVPLYMTQHNQPSEEAIAHSRKRKRVIRVPSGRFQQASFSDIDYSSRNPSAMYFLNKPICSRTSVKLSDPTKHYSDRSKAQTTRIESLSICLSKASPKTEQLLSSNVRTFYIPKQSCIPNIVQKSSNKTKYCDNLNAEDTCHSPRSSILKRVDSGPATRSVSFKLDKYPST